MKPTDINRREFNTLAAAAFGGVLAGTVAGCGKSGSKTAGDGNKDVAEKHLCKGLNTCKGNGAGGKNDCKGQGTCATVAHHDCGGKNECKGLGGCGETVGVNKCKSEGGCQIPLMEKTWKAVKADFDKKHGLGKTTPAKSS